MAQRSARILVVDDEPAMREVLQARLERWGYPVRTAASVQEARALVAAFDPHVVISDLVLPDATGLDLLDDLRADNPARTILLITSYGTIDSAVRAIKAGATDFLTKPLDYGVLREQLESIEQRFAETADEPGPFVRTAGTSPVAGGMVGASPALRAMMERVRAAAASDAPVLIVGESGTGKELVARTIYELGERRKGPLVVVNAAAIPDSLVEGELFGYEKGAFTGAARSHAGLFEQAHGGTLFLDEITEMPASLQPKFLRVLEDGVVRRLGSQTAAPFDVRVIAATNRDPTEAIEKAILRHDLAYRLDVLRIDVPPLRARKEDIPVLTDHFLADCERRYGVPCPELTAGARKILEEHAWPGNVRELRNVIERAFVLARGQPIDERNLGLGASDATETPAHGIVIPHGVTLADAERILILETLKRTANNKAEAARRLGLDVKTIRNKLKVFEAEGVAS